LYVFKRKYISIKGLALLLPLWGQSWSLSRVATVQGNFPEWNVQVITEEASKKNVGEVFKLNLVSSTSKEMKYPRWWNEVPICKTLELINIFGQSTNIKKRRFWKTGIRPWDKSELLLEFTVTSIISYPPQFFPFEWKVFHVQTLLLCTL